LFSEAPAIMRRGLFMIISAASTSGLMTVTPNQLVTAFSSGSFLVLALAMSVGLASGSTAGGIKINRLSIIARSVVATIKRTASADSAIVISKYYHVGKRVVSDAAVKEAMTIFTLFIAMYAIGTLVAIAYGYEATSAIFESVAMASNGGLTSGIVAPDMPAGLESLYILMMWAGRLEFVTLFALGMKIFVSAKEGIRNARGGAAE
jgi:trk system potassium uptake protein TrkH